MKKNENIDASEMMVAVERVNSGLLNNHIHFLNGDIDEYSVGDAIKWIIYENTIAEQDKMLTLYISSCGGSLNDAFALIDIMRQSNCPIRTIGIGSIISAGFLIFSCGTKGERIIAKNTSIMCHQYSGGAYGKHHDLQAHVKEMEYTNTRMINILKEVTGLDDKNVMSKLLPATDQWLTPKEIVDLGIADIIS
jgi:ATP-dependent Clp protease protease subunit